MRNVVLSIIALSFSLNVMGADQLCSNKLTSSFSVGTSQYMGSYFLGDTPFESTTQPRMLEANLTVTNRKITKISFEGKAYGKRPRVKIFVENSMIENSLKEVSSSFRLSNTNKNYILLVNCGDGIIGDIVHISIEDADGAGALINELFISYQ